MKKYFLIISLLLSSFFCFAEGGFYFKFDADASSSLKLKPYLGANVSANYNWNNGFGLGLGIKEYWNIIQDEEEARFIGGPYTLIKYKNISAGAGFLFIGGIGAATFYFNIDGSIPIWEMKRGKLGINFGLDFWCEPVREIIATSSNYGYIQDIHKKYGILDYIKLYAGITYLLPLK